VDLFRHSLDEIGILTRQSLDRRTQQKHAEVAACQADQNGLGSNDRVEVHPADESPKLGGVFHSAAFLEQRVIMLGNIATWLGGANLKQVSSTSEAHVRAKHKETRWFAFGRN
jgi:hypothetical protein